MSQQERIEQCLRHADLLRAELRNLHEPEATNSDQAEDEDGKGRAYSPTQGSWTPGHVRNLHNVVVHLLNLTGIRTRLHSCSYRL